MNSALNSGLDVFLRGTPEFDTPSSGRIADAVLALLALRGADRRTGLPEPTPDLVHTVLLEDVPAYVCATPQELPVFPAVLTALAGRVRATGRLNAKRHARLLASIEDAVPGFERAMTDPENLTWSRWYASLMRTDGTAVDDPAAVREWLAAYDRSPRSGRPVLPAALHRSDVTTRTFATRVLLTEALLAAFARDLDKPSPAGALLPALPLDAPDPEEAFVRELERIGTHLLDRWTAVGLTEALAGPYVHLAPGPESLPHVVLADTLLDEHLDYYGDATVPLPPPLVEPPPDELPGLLHAAALPAALAAPTDDETRELAEQCGFLTPDGPGPAAAVWTDGTPQELLELGADILAAVVVQLAGEPDMDEEYTRDTAHLLYVLYQRGGTADSVARKAAEFEAWMVAPNLEDTPVPVPDTAAAAYTTPAPEELSALLGIPGLNKEDRAALDGPARSLAAVVDRLTPTGCLFRTGDAFGLTPLGGAVLRYALTGADITVSDSAAVAAWDAATVVRAAENWPRDPASRTLAFWLGRREGTAEAWGELLRAIGSENRGTFAAAATRALFTRLDTETAPPEALRAALTDPVLGAYVEQALRARGEKTEEEQVPASARATLILDELDTCSVKDQHREFLAESDLEEAAPDLPAMFDTAAAVWPGGAPALLTALAQADAHLAQWVLDVLRTTHPDPHVTDLAARTACSMSPYGPHRQRKRKRHRR
ncbi:hypothetical protein GCM10020367_52720 [Streptomyces sannanensis]|uniref:Uncharacterized protein n=1 Tax=Streptomyces sannanensis TaxID=285536 RepID=A0ABP6SIH7_9ACTN